MNELFSHVGQTKSEIDSDVSGMTTDEKERQKYTSTNYVQTVPFTEQDYMNMILELKDKIQQLEKENAELEEANKQFSEWNEELNKINFLDRDNVSIMVHRLDEISYDPSWKEIMQELIDDILTLALPKIDEDSIVEVLNQYQRDRDELEFLAIDKKFTNDKFREEAHKLKKQIAKGILGQ